MTTPTPPSDLIACPFCGSGNIDERTRTSEIDGKEAWQAYTECCDCGAQGPATAWYTGATDDPHSRAIYYLRKMECGWNTRNPQAAYAVVRERIEGLISDELHAAIWEAGKCAEPINGYPVSKAELPAFRYGKDCATADIEVAVADAIRSALKQRIDP